jgi:hypothetical protein
MSSLPDHLIQIVALLWRVIDRILPPGHRPAAEGPSLHMILTNRLGTAVRRFARLYALWQAGRLPPLRPARARPAAGPTPAAPHPPRPRLSRARAWLVHRGGHHAAAARCQLETWLARPDLPDFLAAVPRAGRYLRPLAHMLGADLPPLLRLAPRPPRPRRARPPKPRRPRLDSFDPPLAPNIIAAARAWRKNDT